MFKITECKNVIKNFFAEGKYEELKITKLAFLKVMTFAHMAGKYEISGFGRIQDGVITDFKIIKQEVRSAYVEADENAVSDFIRSIPKEQLNEWELDWHSHVDMNAFASTTDTNNYDEMLNLRLGKQFPAMIVNKKGEVEIFNFISKQKMPEIDIEFIDEKVTEEQINEMYEECKKEIEEKLTVYVEPVKTVTNYGSYNNYQQSFFYNPNNNNYYKKKETEKEETEVKSNYCSSCGIWLETDEEIQRGVCNDCMEAMMELNNVY